MISVEELDALDLLIWLGRGEDAALRQACNQSTISRRCQAALRTFDLRLHRNSDGWPCTRRHDLLRRERQLHQLYRLRSGLPLRLDASLLAAPLLHGGIPQGWMAGPLDEVGWQRPLQLLQEHILDAWITGMGQELEGCADPWFVCIPLLQTPLQLQANQNNPLLQEANLQIGDLAGIPRLAPRPGSYPHTEQQLGSWRQQQQPLLLESQARRRSHPQGQRQLSCNHVLHYGTVLSLMRQPALRPLALDLGVLAEASLVVHRDVLEQPPVQELLSLLQLRARTLAAQSSLVATP